MSLIRKMLTKLTDQLSPAENEQIKDYHFKVLLPPNSANIQIWTKDERLIKRLFSAKYHFTYRSVSGLDCGIGMESTAQEGDYKYFVSLDRENLAKLKNNLKLECSSEQIIKELEAVGNLREKNEAAGDKKEGRKNELEIDIKQPNENKLQEFKAAYLAQWNSEPWYRRDPLSFMKRNLDEIKDWKQVKQHAAKNPNSRTSKLLRKIK